MTILYWLAHKIMFHYINHHLRAGGTTISLASYLYTKGRKNLAPQEYVTVSVKTLHVSILTQFHASDIKHS